MATVAFPAHSAQSYADVVKVYCPPHAEVLKNHRPRHADVMKAYHIKSRRRSTAALADREDGWTDVSSMTSCSWPSTLDETSSHGDEHEGTTVSMERDRYGLYYDPLDDPWYDYAPDTRAKAALASEINTVARSQRLYDKVGPLGCPTRYSKPYIQWPSCHHRKESRRDISWRIPPVRLKHLKRRAIREDMMDGVAQKENGYGRMSGIL